MNTYRLPLCGLAVLLIGGAPASCDRPDESSIDRCADPKFEWIIEEVCRPESKYSMCSNKAQYTEACVYGCVMRLCENARDCVKNPDPKWCGTSCADTHGGLFWKNLLEVGQKCYPQDDIFRQPAHGDCLTSGIEKRCPELVGTGWAAQFPFMYVPWEPPKLKRR
jgi:hypothetical protein